MPVTNYPQGVASFGIPQMGPNPLLINPAGAVLFVNSATGRDNRGRVTFPGSSASSVTGGSTQGPQGDPTAPLATVTYALTFTQANRGDIIIVMEGHSETLAANISVANAGVTIYGCGQGDARPLFTTGGFSLVLTGNGSVAANLRFNMATSITLFGVVQLQGNGSYVYNVKVIGSDTTSVGFYLSGNRATMDTCEVSGTTTGFASGVLFNATDELVVRNCNIHGIFAAAPITVAASTNFVIDGNTLRQLSASVDAVISGVVTASSGYVTNNRYQSVHAATAAAYLAGTNVTTNILVIYAQNYGFTGKAGPSSGILIPAVGTIP